MGGGLEGCEGPGPRAGSPDPRPGALSQGIAKARPVGLSLVPAGDAGAGGDPDVGGGGPGQAGAGPGNATPPGQGFQPGGGHAFKVVPNEFSFAGSSGDAFWEEYEPALHGEEFWKREVTRGLAPEWNVPRPPLLHYRARRDGAPVDGLVAAEYKLTRERAEMYAEDNFIMVTFANYHYLDFGEREVLGGCGAGGRGGGGRGARGPGGVGGERGRREGSVCGARPRRTPSLTRSPSAVESPPPPTPPAPPQ